MEQIAETKIRTRWHLQDFRVIDEVLNIPQNQYLHRDKGESLRYCLRRFGFPLTGWDAYKELCRYQLTTHDKRIGLELSFKADGVQVRAMLNRTLSTRIRREEIAPDTAWRKRRDRWVAKTYGRPMFDTWYYLLLRPGKKREREDAIANELYRQYVEDRTAKEANLSGENLGEAFLQHERTLQEEFTNAYQAIEPLPEDVEVDDTPTGQLIVQVLRDALEELERPVRVRDQFFNFFGAVDIKDLSKYDTVLPHWTAGYPAPRRHCQPWRVQRIERVGGEY